MMEYNILSDNEAFGSGLSLGELNQIILELHNYSATQIEQKELREAFGFDGDMSEFEDYLYDEDWSNRVPIKFMNKGGMIEVEENEW